MQDLNFHCPKCAGKLAPFPLMKAATILRRRTCRKCSQRWLVKLAPVNSRLIGMYIHVIEWRMI